MSFLDETGLSYFWNKVKALLKTVAFTGSYSDLTDTPTNHVTTDTDQNITGTKTFVGQKRIKFKQSGSNDKLGFTLFTNNDVEKGYLEYNPTGINGIPLMTLGNYATASNGLTYVGFRRYSNISGASGAYNLLTPLISDAKTPFNLTTTYTNFYLMLGATDGTTTVTVDNTGMLDLSSLLPTIPTNISSFTNDSGYLTSVDWSNILNKPTLATVATTGSYNDLTDKPDLSSIATELISSGGFITTSEASTIIADQISSGGYVTSTGTVASAGVADGLTATADSGYVHISGAETISGEKTFTSGIIVSGSAIISGNYEAVQVIGTGNTALSTSNTSSLRHIDLRTQNNGNAGIWDFDNNQWMIHALSGGKTEIQNGLHVTGAGTSATATGIEVKGTGSYQLALCNTAIVKGTAPTANQYISIEFTGSAHTAVGDRLGLVEHKYTSGTKLSTMQFVAYGGAASNTTTACTITCNVDSAGNAYTTAPTPATADSSTKIATTAFVKAQGYKTTDNNTTYTFATGDSNGQIKVTPSGGSAQNISVKGLGTAAYTASTAYAAASHTHSYAASNHNHDSVYLKLSGGTLTGTYYLKNSNLNIASWPGSGTTHLQYFGGVANDTNNVNIAAISYRVDSAEAASRFYSRQPTDTSTAVSGLPYFELKYVKSGSYWAFSPKGNGSYYLGVSNAKWKQLYASTTTIATSDERFKTNITPISDEILDAWEDIQWKQFKFIDAIQEKGESNARFHNGLIAQQLDSIFKKHNLDITKYGLFCYDSWEAKEPTYITIEDKDENGNIIGSHQELENEGSEAGDSYALRYEEVLCMEAAYQRRRADRAEARITALENRLNELEEALSSLISHGE